MTKRGRPQRRDHLDLIEEQVQPGPPVEQVNARRVLTRLPENSWKELTGWRRGEVPDLKWSNVDLQESIVSLDVGTTKNEEGSVVYMTEELKTLLESQWEERKSSGKLSLYVFPNESRRNRIIKTRFNRAWRKACERAGHPEKLFHDLRRTAVRNMVRAEIPERVAMMISGHKTRSIFDLYNIVDDKDLRQAAHKMEAYHGNLVTAAVTSRVVAMFQRHKKWV